MTLSMPNLFTAKTPSEMIKEAPQPPSDGIITPERPGAIDEIHTGSIKLPPILGKPTYLTNSDWSLINSALSAAVLELKDEASKEWLNPETITHGSVSLINAQKIVGQKICRDFLASSVIGKQDYWFEGKYCRKSGAAWAISDVKEWKKL